MNSQHIGTISIELGILPQQIEAVAALLAEDATVPFIARYRKEATGSLDEVQITAIRDRLSQLAELDARKAAILESLEKHGHLNDELKAKVLAAETMTVLEDIYLPYRPKRRTKATIAKEKGLEPLALILMAQEGVDPQSAAQPYVDAEKGVASVEEALEGARHILAEMINEDEKARARLRAYFTEKAVIQSKVIEGKETEGAKFKDYFDWQEPSATVPSHRMLAMRRGEREEILNLTILPPEAEALEILEGLFVKGPGADSAQVKLAAQDCYKRLLSRSLETELRLSLKERADAEAIRVFADNLRELLLASPLGAKRVMGIDPGFRTGCKVVCLDAQGKLLHHTAIFPHTGEGQARQAAETVRQLVEQYKIEAVAIGNGTAGRETETVVRGLGLRGGVVILMFNESGASVYSASEVARQEFPDHDVTVRGSVSIGRRLMDPLAELVKIDPKSIGVGQYQHDVDQGALKAALDDMVISCVNAVGVDLNRASSQLLTYVSGLGPQLARNIVAHRDANGPFANRSKIRDVPRLGPKAFEQAAGFLRISNGDNPLDASAVHPESYAIVDAMAADLGCTVQDLIQSAELRRRIDIKKYVTDKVGLPTLNDIMAELAKPGRDPRKTFEVFSFGQATEMKDLQPGMKLPGIVTNVTKFGAFVDIGVHQDGLVHVSELADRFVKDPAEVVKVQQKVSVTVLEVDLGRKRISLSMRTGSKPADSVRNGEPKKAPQQKNNSFAGKPAGRKPRPADHPFHNPLADALGKWSKKR
ncbi:MAG: Tex family protein [Desulfobacteraceae bacterium]|nr:Tex family protein [Desulfobacteraceae bacterium]